ncbi:MAG: hypothetical protein ABS37_03300 [Acidovorax sp. SCN 65-108]|nr:MAG: hypothetical protein ABS37_03300 [Acidovorax sp. SCN 65-108]OJV70906.1 MAG: hypothetical protein BGO35_20135 [Burkholderiales bacterium 64-34]
MRGADTFTESLFSVRKLEDFVPASHPLRPIRKMVNAALAKMDALFSRMYEPDIKGGRPSIAPEKLLRAMLLQVLYSVRLECQLMEQVQYNLLSRWFIGLSMDDGVWVPNLFTKNRERLADGYAEREAAKAMVNDARQAQADPTRTITLGADKGYDAREFIEACQAVNVTSHVAQNKSGRSSAVPEAIAQSEGDAVSQQKRKLIEQGFGWAKTVGGMRQVMVRGIKRVDQMFVPAR